MGLLSIFQKKKPLKKLAVQQFAPSKTRYHAVQIVCPSGRTCEAVRKFRGQVFLSAEAPTLAVAGCSHPKDCTCRYKHLADRRRKTRRDTDFGFPPRKMINERRQVSDRRG
jgi:hypothetical protein